MAEPIESRSSNSMPTKSSSWMNVDPISRLLPLYARAPKGKRAYGSVPRNRGKNMTLIAALSEASDDGEHDLGWSGKWSRL